jgi:hypothetical protein
MNTASSKMQSLGWSTTVWLLVQTLIVSSGVSWAAYSVRRTETKRALPLLHNEPRSVPPLYDYPQVASDEQLHLVLDKLRPQLRGPKPKINYVDHALRCWGTEARFADDQFLSGQELRDLLLDYNKFASVWGAKTPWLWTDTGAGLRAKVQDGPNTTSHVDHTLAVLAEVGTPLDYPIVTRAGNTEMRAILEQSLRDFSLNQIEYEWAALAYALYLEPTDHWYTSEGQQISFDRLAERIMRQPLPQGVCYGNHRMHALVMMLRVNDQTEILSPVQRQRVLDYLTDVTGQFVKNQHADGYWNRNWAGPTVDDSGAGDPPSGTLTGRILATGHVLEWWALAPTEVHPPREVLVRAGQWLCRTIEEMSSAELEANYTFLTHAGRALALWRHQNPAEVSH